MLNFGNQSRNTTRPHKPTSAVSPVHESSSTWSAGSAHRAEARCTRQPSRSRLRASTRVQRVRWPGRAWSRGAESRGPRPQPERSREGEDALVLRSSKTLELGAEKQRGLNNKEHRHLHVHLVKAVLRQYKPQQYTVEPPLKETPNKGNLSIMNRITCPKASLSYSTNTFITSEERKPLYNEQNNLSQKLRYSEVPLYMYSNIFTRTHPLGCSCRRSGTSQPAGEGATAPPAPAPPRCAAASGLPRRRR